jgi:hypothetical protein
VDGRRQRRLFRWGGAGDQTAQVLTYWGKLNALNAKIVGWREYIGLADFVKKSSKV